MSGYAALRTLGDNSGGIKAMGPAITAGTTGRPFTVASGAAPSSGTINSPDDEVWFLQITD